MVNLLPLTDVMRVTNTTSRTHAALAAPTQSPSGLLLRRTIAKITGYFEDRSDNSSLERPQENYVAEERKVTSEGTDKATTLRERGSAMPLPLRRRVVFPSWPKKAKQYICTFHL